MTKASQKLAKLANTIEKKYQRSDKDPDQLTWEDTDPDYFGVDSVFDDEDGDLEKLKVAPKASWELMDWVSAQVLPKFLSLSPQEQELVIKRLNDANRKKR